MSKDKEILVILIPGFPKSETDSTCLPSQQLFVRTLKELYPQLDIIVLAFQYPYHTKRYNWFGIPVMPFAGRNKGGLFRLLLRKKIEATLNEIQQTNKIAGLLSFWCGECALTGKRFGDKHGIKHYCWIRGQDAGKENKYPRQIQPGANELIALSDFLQDEFEKNHGIRPQHIIPPGINAKQFTVSPKERDIDMLAAASLIPLKQFAIFIEVVADIKKQLPGIKAVLIGNGPEKDKLESCIIEYGMQSNITLTGELPHSEVLQLMQRTKLFLHPSLYEGFSGVCLEALAAGGHVVSFCRAMKEEIEHWYIVQDKEEMKRKAVDILQDRDTNYSQVLPFLMNDSVKAVSRLFGYGE